MITIEVPDNFPFTPEQIALIKGVSRATIMRALNRKPHERRYLKGEQMANKGPWKIEAVDFVDFKKRIGNDYRRDL